MKTIKIKSNLTPQQEALEIAKQLVKQPTLLSNSTKKLLGKEELEIQVLKTTIEIERIPQGKLMKICSCCDTNFEEGTGFKIWINYGAKKIKKEYCSFECRKLLTEIIPEDRYSFVGTKLKINKFY